MSHRHRQLMHRCDAVSQIIDYFMGQYSPEWVKQEEQNKKKKDRTRIADFENKLYPDLTSFMATFALNFRALKTTPSKENWRPETAFADCPLLEMSDRTRPLFFDREMLVALLKMGYNLEANAEICAHVSWDNADHSALVLSCCSDALLKATAPVHVGNVFTVLDRLLSINDELMFWRVAVLFQQRDFGIFYIVRLFHDPLPNERRDPALLDFLIEWLALTIRSRPLAVGWMVSTRDSWRFNLTDSISSRIRSLKNSGAPEPRVHQMQEHFKLIDQAANNSLPDEIEQFWDPAFSLSAYSIQTVPKDPTFKR